MNTRAGILIGGVPATSLAEEYATPLYVYEAAAFGRLSQNSRGRAIQTRKVHYACVANSNLAIMRLVKSLGGGIHANTWGDAVMALRAGFGPRDIVYSGSNLGQEEHRQRPHSRRRGQSQFSFSAAELRLTPPRVRTRAGKRPQPGTARIGLRIHLEEHRPYSRMGVKTSEVDEAKAIAAEYGLDLVGVHYYRGTGTTSTDHFLQPFPMFMAVARRFVRTLKYVDIGGGFGFQYVPSAPKQFEWERFGEQLAHMMEQLSADLGRRSN